MSLDRKGPIVGESGQAEPGPGAAPRALATMSIVLYADGNWAYEAPVSNLAVCHSMVGMMAAELAGLQYERTKRARALVTVDGLPAGGPG